MLWVRSLWNVSSIHGDRLLTFPLYSPRNVLSTHESTSGNMAKKDTEEKAALSYLVPLRLKQDLQALADADHRELGPYIRLVLQRHVDQQKREKSGKR